ncbi:3-demethylubiquinone-9 3-methyltransferase [Liberibacter crescens BT-1]|uniref:Ubiquinone biosynthesis O-methyltransferase n=1 Tax=Liberibacter crescens (strain BT-1) TaxID=1215343 RepID=L0ERZ2_LIBCB|nr:bifunctional 2-polyprenyl-6-hydroxyphenol methylase/3-demethylubiquinol 3-O-methyltransferase UbiG [Liberibacter crescens]AGA64269.1 3-demethylubiquinone-9 3-methyltransferase [Liberibacter crescens BT-1]AMC12502.1 3-demethylubiquinone-9 3-methyltransferase [Liberibacter crescens]
MTKSKDYITIDPAEIEHFSNIANEWWNPQGKFKPLHKINPIRIEYIRNKIIHHFKYNVQEIYPLKGLRVLDLGCGGGLLSEPIAEMGADVIGIDPSPKNIEVAIAHSRMKGIVVDYRTGYAEDLAASKETFDVILNMEIVEHVVNISSFIQICCSMLRKNGLMFISTINRNLKAMLLAIVAAEYLLQWLPKGTHHYKKLVTPEELNHLLLENNMNILDCTGVTFNILCNKWKLSQNTDVNYMMLAQKLKYS